MKKYLMTIQFHVEAEGRSNAWEVTRGIVEKHLRDLADIISAHELDGEDAADAIAVNEPIKAKR